MGASDLCKASKIGQTRVQYLTESTAGNEYATRQVVFGSAFFSLFNLQNADQQTPYQI